MRQLTATRASSWAVLMRINDTRELVAVTSQFRDADEAEKWGRHPWFEGRATYINTVALTNLDDFVTCMEGTR